MAKSHIPNLLIACTNHTCGRCENCCSEVVEKIEEYSLISTAQQRLNKLKLIKQNLKLLRRLV